VRQPTAASLESSSDQWIGNFLVHLVYPLKWVIFLLAFILLLPQRGKKEKGMEGKTWKKHFSFPIYDVSSLL
jgi:hypothetical protein